MVLRALMVVGLLTALKAVAYFGLVSKPSGALIELFAVADGLAVVALSIWVAMGRPRPSAWRDLWRAPGAPALLVATLALENILLQVPLLGALARESGEAGGSVFGTLWTVVNNATLAGPLGGFAIWLVATVGTGLVVASSVGQAVKSGRSPSGRRGPSASARAGQRRADRLTRQAA
jgi:hypothetical protein